MVAYVFGFVALSVISNALLMWMVRQAPILEGRARARMLPGQPKLPMWS